GRPGAAADRRRGGCGGRRRGGEGGRAARRGFGRRGDDRRDSRTGRGDPAGGAARPGAPGVAGASALRLGGRGTGAAASEPGADGGGPVPRSRRVADRGRGTGGRPPEPPSNAAADFGGGRTPPRRGVE